MKAIIYLDMITNTEGTVRVVRDHKEAVRVLGNLESSDNAEFYISETHIIVKNESGEVIGEYSIEDTDEELQELSIEETSALLESLFI